MHIILNNSSMIPIYEQLTEQIKTQILDGSLKSGEGLPSVRTLAGELKISALTVKKSYVRLEAEGFVVTIHGKGTYVAEANLQLQEEIRKKKVEDTFADAIAGAKGIGMTEEEIRQLVNLLLEE